MKTFIFDFHKELTPEQEDKLYCGFSAFYYDVCDGLDEGIKKLTNNPQKIRFEVLRNSIDNILSWKKIEPGKYEFKMDDKLLDSAIPFFSWKLSHKLKNKVQRLVLPAMGFKKEDVEIRNSPQ